MAALFYYTVEDMKKTMFSVAVIAALAGVSWHYASPRTHESLLGFIGMASRRDTAEGRRALGDVILPKDPAARRAALTGQLGKSIRELQRRAIATQQGADAATAAGFAADDTLAAKKTAEILAGVANAIKELEGANTDASLGTRVTERILERILPTAQCKE